MEMAYLFTFLAISSITAIVQPLHLPNYVRACHRNDPNLNECAKTSAEAAIPYIVQGDQIYKIPKLNPLKLPLIEIDPSPTLKIQFTNIVLSGLETAKLEDIKFDLEKRHIYAKISTAYITLIADVNVNGRILILPIEGNGPANFTFQKGYFEYESPFDIFNKNGKNYMTNFKPTMNYKLENPHYSLENLFDNDKTLGDHMNKFLNENHKYVYEDLSPSVSQTISAIVTSIMDAFLLKVSYDEIFLP